MFSDSFLRSFREIGQDCHEIIVDFEIIQKKWAKENNVLYTAETWMIDILMAQVNQIRPDVVYIQSHLLTTPGIFIKNKPDANLIEILKQEYMFIKKVLIFSGYPSALNRLYHADFLFYATPRILEGYKRIGLDSTLPCELMYHSFDPKILSNINENEIKYDFTFAGSSRENESRYFALVQLLEETNLELWINEQKPVLTKNSIKQNMRDYIKNMFHIFNHNHLSMFSNKKYFPMKLKNILNELAQEKIAFKGVNRSKDSFNMLSNLYPDNCHEPLIGIDMYRLLSQSRITFNKHADAAFGDVGNMRMFEATGVGTCLLTDTGDNMTDLFEENKEVVVYRTIDEAVDKLRYLQENPDIIKDISKAGQSRTLKDHTIMNRCEQIDNAIQKLL